MSTISKDEVCPRCFSETGQSIVLKEEDGVYKCPNNPNHKFEKEDGFLQGIEEDKI